MRVLWLIDSLAVGGAEAAAFARAVDPRRVELHVASLHGTDSRWQRALEQLGIPLSDLRARHRRDLAAFRRLLRLVRRQRIDLVHAHGDRASIWAGLCARLTGLPSVATLGAGPADEREPGRGAVPGRLLAFVLNRWCSGVVAVSEAARTRHLQGGRIRGDRVAVIHNGIDVEAHAAAGRERDRARRELGLRPNQQVVMALSALREGKGLDVLLRAVASLARDHARLRLLVAGEGPLRERLETLVRNCGLEGHVRWLGQRDDVAELLAAADVFVLPSLYEDFPAVLVSAMAAARPVVATRAGAIPEVVEDQRSGLLVPPGDAVKLAGAVDTLLRDPERAAALGAAACERARERFSARAWTARLEAQYRGALGQDVPSPAALEAV